VDTYFAIKESGWSKEIQDLVLAGKVEVGMTTHMVFYALGRPDEVTESGTAKQQWAYKKPGTQPLHLYFEDGVLTNVSN
jgi:outer membrane protein assembly factor BamE (lipoprotein component of BamABCDE complex)